MLRWILLCFLVMQWPMATAAVNDAVEIVIVRGDKKLLVRQNNVVIRSFDVALGSGGRQAKEIEGDRLTPTGSYRIMQVRNSDQFYLFMHLNYPNVDDAKNALQQGRIDRGLYRKILGAHIYNELPPQNTPLGGAIGIHGIGDETDEKLGIHELSNWTRGCIALRNSEVRELTKYVQVGTPVIIVDSLK
jgi:murein L,D-transpeptidase YafK